MESMLKSIWGSIVTPGVGRGLFIALNVSLGLLFAALIFITVVGYADIHVAVMGFLALGLTVSVNWFVMKLRTIQARAAEQASASDEATTTSSTAPTPVADERPKAE